MKDMEQNLKELEAAQRAVDLSEQGHSLSAEEVDELQGDELKMRAYRTLFYARAQGGESADGGDAAEWQRIRQNHYAKEKARKKARTVRLALWSAAACVLALAVVTLTLRLQKSEPGEGTFSLVSPDNIKEVILQSEDGDSLSLSKAVSKSALIQLDAKMDASGKLVYSQNATDDEDEVQLHAISTPRGKDFNFVLADGTRVWLNGGSRIEYPSRFEGEERVVSLYGEAYFAVAKDPTHPFIIKTSRTDTRVLGTQLDVCDYTNRQSEVTLVTGVAEVASTGRNAYTRLRPGQNAALKPDGGITVRNVDTELYTAWKDGYFSFDSMTLGEVMRHIADWYGVDVVFDRPALTQLRLRYYNERTTPLADNIRVLNSFGSFTVALKGNTLHIK